jgi:hypothetical protein
MPPGPFDLCIGAGTKITLGSCIPLLRFRLEVVEVLQRTVHRVNIFVVRNVVTEVNLWRRETRRNPDGIDAELLQIVQLRGNPIEIADPIIIAVGKAARVEFIEDGMMPSLMSLRINGSILR